MAKSNTLTNEPVAGISKEQAQEILKTNIENIVKKSANGIPLTAAQLSLISQAAVSDETTGTASPTVVYAKTQQQLAQILGFKDRKLIQRWLKEPGAPKKRDDGRYDVAEWKAFAKTKGYSFEEDGESSNQAKAKAKNVLLQNKLLDFKFKLLRKEYVPAADVEKWGAHLGGEIRKVVISIHKLASSLAGLPTAEIERLLREHEDEILLKLHLLAQRTDEMKEAANEK